MKQYRLRVLLKQIQQTPSHGINTRLVCLRVLLKQIQQTLKGDDYVRTLRLRVLLKQIQQTRINIKNK